MLHLAIASVISKILGSNKAVYLANEGCVKISYAFKTHGFQHPSSDSKVLRIIRMVFSDCFVIVFCCGDFELFSLNLSMTKAFRLVWIASV
jgi:hypothetical protein